MMDLLLKKVPLATERGRRGGREAEFQEIVAVTLVRDGASWAGVMAVCRTGCLAVIGGHDRVRRGHGGLLGFGCG